MYSFGIERVAYVLANKLNLPVPDVHLDEMDGSPGVASIALPGPQWASLDAATLDRTTIENRTELPLCLAFDVLIGNPDRQGGNILLDYGSASPSVAETTSARISFMEFGLAGQWPPAKLG
jgi:hypothetical protein